VVVRRHSGAQDFSEKKCRNFPDRWRTLKYRSTWTLPLVFRPIDPHVLYFGSQVCFERRMVEARGK